MSRTLIVLALLASACSAAPTPTTASEPPGPGPSSTAAVVLPLTGTPLPELTPGTTPAGVQVLAETSAPLPSAPPPATATPTPDPNIWRFEGRVVDEDGSALTDVCVVIGPHGCQRFSPHTDQRGVYFFDVPQVPTVQYDLYFVKQGYAVVWYPVKPTGPTIFNVVLRKSP